MHRRILAVVLAALSFAAVAVVASEDAQSKPLRDRHAAARSQHHATHSATRAKRAAVRAKRVAYAARRTAQRNSRRTVARQAKPAAKILSRRARVAARQSQRGRRTGKAVAPTVATAGASAQRMPVYDPQTGTVGTYDSLSGTGGRGLFGGGSSDVVVEARRWIGSNPTGRRSLWCARFMNFVLERTGRGGTGSDMARSFDRYGRRLMEPQIGAIAVMSRGGRGGHVGIVSGIDERGNPIIISGNHGNRVAESTYPRGRIRAYVMPGT